MGLSPHLNKWTLPSNLQAFVPICARELESHLSPNWSFAQCFLSKIGPNDRFDGYISLEWRQESEGDWEVVDRCFESWGLVVPEHDAAGFLPQCLAKNNECRGYFGESDMISSGMVCYKNSWSSGECERASLLGRARPCDDPCFHSIFLQIIGCNSLKRNIILCSTFLIILTSTEG